MGTPENDNRGAQWLRQKFGEHGAQSDLAARTGINQSWLSRIFWGAVPNLRDGIALQKEGCDPVWFAQPPLGEEAGKGAA